ncbi:MAG: 1-deoxy-D-xylulose-5-phosphate synthase [Candidatus Omnitrophica bacterium]|jgi:1-deoxy-D-xylulose-5-phosphate synthase|nr:1-deoxy-D-xylulose-5-phosphate synthase [Candidatus Omnitrophota bacterium]
MILEKIDSPQDLKNLNLAALKTLSQEIRDLIIEVVSKKGGHPASSLGAVELCLALHYCLDTPRDSLIFDVGHQAYAHKIITGRRKSFGTLREYQGLSGFPNFKESVYDIYISGHASTAVSWAQGIAEAKKLNNDDSKTVAVVGDGSLSGGMCFEALNNCGHYQSNVMVIVNHNEMSISRSVGALGNHLTKIISAPIYNRIRKELESFLEHFSFAKKLTPRAKKFEESLKGLIVPGLFFEELGFRYFGPIDGHNLDVLIPTIKNILSLDGPRILHVITKKGKGYKFSEDNPEDFHSSSAFNIDNGQHESENKVVFGEILAEKLSALAEKNKKIVAITAAMPKGTGLYLFQDKFPERFFDVGIAEAQAVGLASGLAKKGFKPVVAIYSTFLQRSFDQIIHDVALQDLGVIFLVDRAGLVGEDGPTHHGVFDIGYLRLIPNMVCMTSKDKEELEDMLEFALGLNCPVSIRYPKGGAYSLGYREPIKLGKSQIIKEGKDICLLASGSMVKVALESLSLLKDKNISLVNARFIKPLDEKLLDKLAQNFKTIIVLEESSLACGFGSAVLEYYESKELLASIKLLRIGLPDEFIPSASREKLFEIYGLDAPSLAEKIKKLLSNYEPNKIRLSGKNK